MFRNYLSTALNNLVRNRLYAGIAILGLAVAFTVAILIGEFVRNEFSYDRWIPGHQQIYQIETVLELTGQKSSSTLLTTGGIAGRLRAGFPQAVAVARLQQGPQTVRHRPGDEGATEPNFAWADQDIFKIFPLPVLGGDPATALQQPDTLVVTRSAARRYFGRDLPLGDTLEVQLGDNSRHLMRVAAVLKDLPPTTNLGTEIYASGRSAYSRLSELDAHPTPGAFGSLGLLTFVRLSPGVSTEDFQRALDVAGQPDDASARAFGDRMKFRPMPLDEVHWAMQGPATQGTKPSGNKGVTYSIAAIAGLIVLVAAINFVTLMTARAARRGIEVGVRKATGAQQIDLVIQFMAEALIQVAISALMAVALAEVLVGPFGAFVQRTLSVDLAHDPLLLCAIAGSTVVIGVLAAIYPALVLSSFQPAAVLKGGVVGASGSPAARATLVTIQFAVLVGLILTTTTIYRQTQFALARGLGASDSKLIANVYAPCDGAFANEVRKLPGVSAAACASLYSLNQAKMVAPIQVGGGRQETFDAVPVDVGFFELFGVKPLAGRLFSREHGEDSALAQPSPTTQPTVVVNETAGRKLGFSDPRAAVGQQMLWTRALEPHVAPVTGRSEIVGVVPDVPATVRAPVQPVFYFLMPKAMQILSIKMTGQDVPGTMRAIEATWKQTGNGRPIRETFLYQTRLALYVDLIIQGEAIAICAALAILIAGVGLFGLSAYMTERRTKEMGLRKAMGADTRNVVLLFLWQFTLPVLAASAVAVPIGYAAMNWWLHGFAYHVQLSTWTFVLAAGLAVAIAWATVSFQSWTVARAKPATALRYE